ncbi:MAG: hypothetical protein ACXQS8_08235 [Candidatus Helarchaeales archaeon]
MTEEKANENENSTEEKIKEPELSEYEKKEIQKFQSMRPKVKISEEEIRRLEELAKQAEETPLTTDEATVLDILTRRKFLDQIVREFNLALKPLGKPLASPEKIEEILKSLEEKEKVKKIQVKDKFVWVATEYYSEKLFGTDRL